MLRKFLAASLVTVVWLFLFSNVVLAEEDLDKYPSEGAGGVFNLMVGGGSTDSAALGGLNAIKEVVYEEDNPVEPLPMTILKIIKLALTTLGTIFVILMVYAGVRWMTSGGNEEQVTEAKSLIRNAAIGLAIVLCSYAITVFIFNIILQGIQT